MSDLIRPSEQQVRQLSHASTLYRQRHKIEKMFGKLLD